MVQRELYLPEDKPQFMDVIDLKQTLQELKHCWNKPRIVLFTGMIDGLLGYWACVPLHAC